MVTHFGARIRRARLARIMSLMKLCNITSHGERYNPRFFDIAAAALHAAAKRFFGVARPLMWQLKLVFDWLLGMTSYRLYHDIKQTAPRRVYRNNKLYSTATASVQHFQ